MSDLFDFKPQATDFAVMGNPVAHSRSPEIHARFARQFEIKLSYTRIQVDLGGFNQAVSHFFAHGGGGLNITLPYKINAWHLCQTTGNILSARARISTAVNTLMLAPEGGIIGDNTDGVGLVNDLVKNIGINLAEKRILIVGAGGAVRGVMQPLLHENPESIVVCNRTYAKAQNLSEHFTERLSAPVVAQALDSRPAAPYDLVINGTSSSIDGRLPGINAACIGTETHAYDMMYSHTPTIFMKWAWSLGAKSAHDGLGMLVEQAAESFSIWHGQSPTTQSVIAAIRRRHKACPVDKFTATDTRHDT